MENKITNQLPDEVATQALSNINETVTLLSPYLIALNPQERQSLPKMSDGTAPFVEKCLDYCQSNPQFAPPYIDIEGFKSDMGMWKQLIAVLRPLQQLM